MRMSQLKPSRFAQGEHLLTGDFTCQQVSGSADWTLCGFSGRRREDQTFSVRGFKVSNFTSEFDALGHMLMKVMAQNEQVFSFKAF
ncbi:Hypothetical predicted protein [Xyrichtys novacula]|uniref:Uncharacterized protein n=1 Tax=Xyrichtys novacula TaxID=13765 RepID=A0AAV1H8H9_XYRNO|nr:Hypothetical predicted protein [Xyrichtys novacula]